MDISTIFATDERALIVSDKKGRMHAVTPEGCLFRGGVFLAAMKDAALESALTKAVNGRYRSAADILTAAFPAIGRMVDKLLGTAWANKSNMLTLVNATLRETPKEGKELSVKQAQAQMLARALLSVLDPQPEPKPEDTIDAPVDVAKAE